MSHEFHSNRRSIATYSSFHITIARQVTRFLGSYHVTSDEAVI